jgi:hypothetical protein
MAGSGDEDDLGVPEFVSTLLGDLAELMNKHHSADHPDVDAFIERHRDKEEFVSLAKYARWLWRCINKQKS